MKVGKRGCGFGSALLTSGVVPCAGEFGAGGPLATLLGSTISAVPSAGVGIAVSKPVRACADCCSGLPVGCSAAMDCSCRPAGSESGVLGVDCGVAPTGAEAPAAGDVACNLCEFPPVAGVTAVDGAGPLGWGAPDAFPIAGVGLDFWFPAFGVAEPETTRVRSDVPSKVCWKLRMTCGGCWACTCPPGWAAPDSLPVAWAALGL